ncbi:MAG: glycosyltransferase [Pseudomonadota bacterium]
MYTVWIGFDGREVDAFAVARSSIYRRSPIKTKVYALVLADLQAAGLYTRPTSKRAGLLWDNISDAEMSTEFANSRFLVPYLCGYRSWAVFMDCDMLLRAPISDVFKFRDPSKAVMCVQHNHVPTNTEKMDGQVQSQYARKNWSSFMLLNCEHPSNRQLTPGLVNELPGRDLHAFCWLDDDEIGELGPEWNYLVGHSDPSIDPKCVHFTEGGPWFAGYENVEYADEWRDELRRWAMSRSEPLLVEPEAQ